MAKVGKDLAGALRLTFGSARGEHHGADWYGQAQVVALRTVFRVAQAHRAVAGGTVRHETIIQQRIRVRVSHENHRSAFASIAAVRSGQRLVLLPADAGGAIAAVSALHMHCHSIYKVTHNRPFYPTASIHPPQTAAATALSHQFASNQLRTSAHFASKPACIA